MEQETQEQGTQETTILLLASLPITRHRSISPGGIFSLMGPGKIALLTLFLSSDVVQGQRATAGRLEGACAWRWRPWTGQQSQRGCAGGARLRHGQGHGQGQGGCGREADGAAQGGGRDRCRHICGGRGGCANRLPRSDLGGLLADVVHVTEVHPFAGFGWPRNNLKNCKESSNTMAASDAATSIVPL